MPLNIEDKKAVVAEVSAQVAKAQTIVVAEYRGIAVGDLTRLRATARQQGVYLRVLKNTLARRAVEGTPFELFASDGQAVVFSTVWRDDVNGGSGVAEPKPDCYDCYYGYGAQYTKVTVFDVSGEGAPVPSSRPVPHAVEWNCRTSPPRASRSSTGAESRASWPRSMPRAKQPSTSAVPTRGR